MEKPLWAWVIFIGIILSLLIFDLKVLHRKQHEINIRESLLLSAFYIIIALLYGVWIWHSMGEQSAKEYLTGYLIEKSLSVDNIFVMSLIFNFFAIPRKYQHKVLFWGVLGVIVLRAIMIGLGALLVFKISWVLYIFAAFLIITGIKMLFVEGEIANIGKNPLIKFLSNHLRITPEIHEEKFFIKQLDQNTGHYHIYYTPLFVAMIIVEFTDIIFAVDSIPAVFAITTNPYIVYTSNIFAILGLRSLYFALSAIIYRFIYLKYALAIILVFIGSKVFITDMLGLKKIPAGVSLSITFGLLAVGILFSLYKTRK